jgi:hypothetical protein
VTAGLTPVVSIAAASTTAPGAVQLNNTVASTSTTLALTAAQGKVLQDQITTLLTTPGIDLAGTIDASTGFVASVTSVGSTAGYTVGAVLPAADATTVNTYVVVTTPGTLTPPGGSATAATRGDWFLASETAPGVYSWQFLNVGFDAPAATDTVAGIVELATDAETQTGTDTTRAVTPAGAAATYVPLADYTAKGDILAATAANTPTALAVGIDGQLLVACAAATTGLCWLTVPPTLAATPTVAGVVLGCTTASNASIGCNAFLGNTTGTANVALGGNALCSNTVGEYNAALGFNALGLQQAGCYSVAVGGSALRDTVVGACNTAVGFASLLLNTGAGNNTAVGFYAGACITTGQNNTAIGYNTQVASPTGSCQLAIGYNTNQYWLTGDSSKNVKFWAGLRDYTDSLGTNGQVLTSNGTVAQWATAGLPASFTSAGTLQSVGLTATGGTSPVPGATLRNNVSYRQIGAKQWEVFYTLTANGAWTNAGSGDYLFTLPNSLNFDTTIPWQPIWTGSVGAGSQENRWYWIPGASSIQVGTNSSGSVFGNGVAVYSATKFRLFATDGGNSSPAPVSSFYWGGLSTTNFSISFQFTAP